MFGILGIIIIIIGIIACWGYYRLILRIVKTYKEKIERKLKAIILAISIIITALTINLFSMYGLFLLHFLIITYLLEFIYYLVKKITKKEILKLDKIRKFCIIPLIITSICFIYGYYNINNVVETTYTIKTTKNISKNYRIALITDIHYGAKVDKEKIKNAIDKIASVKPDIVVLGGDIVDESTENSEMKEIFSLLGGIKSELGTYYVYGNHDRQTYTSNKKYTVKEMEDTMASNNISILYDEGKVLNEDIIIYGREDKSAKRKNISEYINLEENSEKFAIMVDHQPVDYNSSKENLIDLIVSGHTHAGQIFPVKYFIDILKTADLAYGYQKYDNLNAIVSSGMFGWGYPIRTSEHSEYVIIDVEK